MATKQELVRDMRSQFNGQSICNLAELETYLGWKRDKLRSVLNGVDCYKDGKEWRFHVLDVAERISESKTIFIYGDD